MTTQHPADWRDCPSPSCDHPAHWTACPVCGQDNGPETGGCDRYGIPTPEPHYPSTAELRDFRASIGARAEPGSLAWRAVRAVGGIAFADERAHGIGAQEPHGWRFHDPATHWRREASALRSRAYDAIRHELATGDASWSDAERAAFGDALETFAGDRSAR